MKKFVIGDESCWVLESIDEMNYKRSVVFNEWAMLTFEQPNHSLFVAAYDRATNLFNEQKFYQALNEFTDYKLLIELKDFNVDALGRCFTLICLTDEEKEKNLGSDPIFWDENYMKDKLRRWSDAGLTRGQMQKEFENFMKTSPSNYVPFLEKMAMMSMLDNLGLEKILQMSSETSQRQ